MVVVNTIKINDSHLKKHKILINIARIHLRKQKDNFFDIQKILNTKF